MQGFLCEAHAVQRRADISSFGGWRAYLAHHLMISATENALMDRRDFISGARRRCGIVAAGRTPRWRRHGRKDLLIVANETGPNSLDIHTVGANRAGYGVSLALPTTA